jgi:hypothetical protein
MVGAYEEVSSWDKYRCDERLPKASDGLRLGIKMQELGNVKKVMLLASVINDVDIELTIVLVSDGINGSIVTLLNVVHLNVDSLVDSSENLVVFCQRVTHDFKVLIFVIDDSHTLFRVICDDNLNHIFIGVNECSESEILEELSVFVKLLETLDMGLIR